MIVRCKKCNSAFAVDDGKVKNKKFAFTCPKCNNENIFDNRKETEPAFVGPTVIDEEFSGMPERAPRNEAVVGTGREPFYEEPMAAKVTERAPKNDILADDELMLDDSAMVDSDDLSGLAEPEKIGEMDSSLEQADLPPADDMRSDVPLDDLNIDDDLKDLGITDIDLEEKPAKEKKPKEEPADTIFDELDLDTGDVKLDDDIILDEMEPKEGADAPVHLDEIDDIDKLLAEDEKKKEIVDEFEPLEVETATVDSRQLEPDMVLDEEIKTEEVYRAKEPMEDESITIDLDTLDIDLEESGEAPVKKATDTIAVSEDLGLPDAHEVQKASRHEGDEDENITIDLDTLDIDLQETTEPSKGESHEELDLDLSDFSEETIQELEEVAQKPKPKEDEDITLDLNSLDISLEESDEIQRGEALDEDEKLTLEDAGLTLEELTTEELTSVSSGPEAGRADEEDIRLTVEELGPDIDMNQIEKELKEAESILVEQPKPRKKEDLLVVDELSDLPEIDFDRDLELADMDTGAVKGAGGSSEEDLFKLDDREKGVKVRGGLQKDIPDMVPKGSINFSIDYSIKYSRVGALLRLFGFFFFGLIPHYVVFLVYNLLSVILGFINQILVIFTEKNIEDFSEIHENTLRYLLSISASSIGIVEEMPIFAGRDNIDYPLQMRIIYPLRSSRLLAFLRLSVIGIIVLTLPHLVILGIMSLVIPIMFLVGILSVLITGGWPHLLFDFMIRYYRYIARVMAFSIGIIDVYPNFKFD